MSVRCVIPARYDSTRFPGKLMVNIFGKTLIQRTFESAQKCKKIDEIYIATDSEIIKEHAESFGANVLWTSSKPKNGTERIIEALSYFEPLQKASAILNLQGDHPCVDPGTMEAVISSLLENDDAHIATAVCPIKTVEEFLMPQLVKCVFDQKKSALYFSRSPIPHHPKGAMINAHAHIGLYCYRPSFLHKLATMPLAPLQLKEDLEQLQFLEWGYKIQVAIVEKGSIGVDVPTDINTLEEFLCKNPQ